FCVEGELLLAVAVDFQDGSLVVHRRGLRIPCGGHGQCWLTDDLDVDVEQGPLEQVYICQLQRRGRPYRLVVRVGHVDQADVRTRRHRVRQADQPFGVAALRCALARQQATQGG